MPPDSSDKAKVFRRDASIILLGMPGSGKSTLAAILSFAFNWPIRESTHFFKTKVGQSQESFKKNSTAETYRSQLHDVVQSLLKDYSWNHVLVLDIATVQNAAGPLREFAKGHIMVYVERDADGIAEHLRSWPRNKIQQLQRIATPLFRACANYDYYNITEHASGNTAQPISYMLEEADRSRRPSAVASTPSLLLKSVERDFVNFICKLRGVENGMAWDVSSPISKTLTEKRTYTYAVSISLQDIRDADIEAAAVAADAVEITIDSEHASDTLMSEISIAYTRVRRKTTLPVILHTRRGSNGDVSLAHYFLIIEHCLRLVPDYVSLDLSCSVSKIESLLARRGCVKAIAHLNLSKQGLKSWRDERCFNKYVEAKELGFDVVRMCMKPSTVSDNYALQSLHGHVDQIASAHPPLVAYNTGLLGRTSICLNSAMTPVKASAMPMYEQDEEAPCITAKESTAALFGIFVHVPLDFWFVATDTSHALSHVMHNAAFEAFGIRHRYHARHCLQISDFRALTDSPSFGGISIGASFKVDATKIVQSLSGEAEAIGAINNIIPARRKVLSDTSFIRASDRHIGHFQGADELHGDNTDWIGITMCILRGLSPVNAIRSKTSALVIGAGSMAKAAIYALMCLGVQNITISNRTQRHAEDTASRFLGMNRELAERSKIDIDFIKRLRIQVTSSLDDPIADGLVSPTIIISCIPTSSSFRLPDQWLTSVTGGVVIELGYESTSTPLVHQIQERAFKGWVILRGIDFLPEQGCPEFELFTGRRAPRRLMRTEMLAAYQARKLNTG